MAKDTDPLTRSDIAAGAAPGAAPCSAPHQCHAGQPCPAPRQRAAQRTARRRTRPWTLMLFVLEVAIVIALVWFSWAGGSWS